MAKVHIQPRAEQDLIDIWGYTFEQWDERQATLYYRTLIDGCEKIARHPTIGKSYEEFVPGLRGYRVEGHLILYRILEGRRIVVTRILHGRMDVARHLRE